MTQLPEVSSETVNQIQANLIAYLRIFAGLPGIIFVEGDATWNVGGPGPHILGSRLLPEHVDQQIDDLVRQIGLSANSVDWFVNRSLLRRCYWPGGLPASLIFPRRRHCAV